jgi:L-ascorbate metabolism protein UlaG (beta-lactamase superfamily)
MTRATITLIEGPTTLIELDGFRLLTDPTFDDPGDYTLPRAILKKTAKPALAADQIGAVDALLSHDQPSDNLDVSGRALLQKADRVFTTFAGAVILPIHTDGWAHFTESGDDLEKAFKALGHGGRMRRLQPGVPTVFEL